MHASSYRQICAALGGVRRKATGAILARRLNSVAPLRSYACPLPTVGSVSGYELHFHSNTRLRAAFRPGCIVEAQRSKRAPRTLGYLVPGRAQWTADLGAGGCLACSDMTGGADVADFPASLTDQIDESPTP